MIIRFPRRPMSERPSRVHRLATACVLAAVLAVAPRPADAQPAPYDADLMRLSEILGALTWLDGLCGSPEPGAWRASMERIIVAQRMDGDERRRYVDVFNRGHRTFAAVHRGCTAQTRFVIDRYMREGVQLVARLEQRFGRVSEPTELPRN
jgi:uncharacterized protein (TIGR02301 family)